MRRTLGDRSALSRGEARQVALRMLKGEEAAPAVMRLAAFNERYMADMQPQWRETTYLARVQLVRAHLIPQLGNRDVASLTPLQVQDWYDALALATGTKNLALAHLSGMMRHAELLGIRKADSNPCKGMRKLRVAFNAHYLTADEYRRLGKVLKAAPGPVPALLRFLAMTGCRVGEARRLRWDYVEADRINLPDSKTGVRTIWLGAAARRLLGSLHKRSELVFSDKEKPLSEGRVTQVWKRLRTQADLEGVRAHDLRHSYASVAINRSESLRTIAGLLGHADLGTTQGYAHLKEDALRASAERVAGRISRVLRPLAHLERKTAPEPEIPPVCQIDDELLRQARAFLSGRMGLPSFARKRGLHPDALRKAVLALREQRKGGRK